MLRIVPHTVPRIGRSYEHFPDGFELHLLPREDEPAPSDMATRMVQVPLKHGIRRPVLESRVLHRPHSKGVVGEWSISEPSPRTPKGIQTFPGSLVSTFLSPVR